MKKIVRWVSAALLGLGSVGASPENAASIVAAFEQERDDWTRRINAAETVEDRRALWEQAPDTRVFGERMLREMDDFWSKEWTLDYSPKLIQLAPRYVKEPSPYRPDKTPLGVIRDSAERFHFTSEKIGDLAVSLVMVDNGPKTRELIERLEATHASKKVQGQAALALAMLLGEAGGNAELNARRLKLIEKAIINSAQADAAGMPVAERAQALIKQITTLEKGMQAPDLLGWNVSGDALRLSDYRGKPVALVFWHARMQAAEETVEYLRGIQERLVPKGIVVLGVACESTTALRSYVKEGTVTWENFVDPKSELAKIYQVNRYPMAWVLDQNGRVAYRGVPGAFMDLTAEALLKE
ncbi:MAG: redoxin domain-containing protein [Verrucomicrobiota bacterium JB023]|nr:redoxin domain-containing protein [Verrucomicrobiota bacterium JB023]